MKLKWKVGELAQLTGLTIRTLRYYDKIQLFSPSERTNSGHRLYTQADLQRLHQILVLKEMGLSLEEIQLELKEGTEHSAESIIDKQIARVENEIEMRKQLQKQLLKIKVELPNKKEVSIQELSMVFQMMKLNRESYFSEKHLKQLKEHYQTIPPTRLNEMEQAFKDLLRRLQHEMKQGTSPTDKEVQRLAIMWKKIAYSFSNENKEFEQQAERFHQENPNNVIQFGLDAELFRYIQSALRE